MSQQRTLPRFLAYFLKMGAVVFGGPVVLISHMQRDLVDKWGWITEDEFKQGMALSQMAPGPLATQLAIYLGWVRYGVLGASLTGLALIIPSFLIVLALSELYIHFGGLPWIRDMFYGVGACVIAIMVMASHKLVKRTLGKDKFLWLLTLMSAAITYFTHTEIFSAFVLAGFFTMLVKAPPRWRGSVLPAFLPAGLFAGLSAPASWSTLGNMAIYFLKAGAMVFGSGFAIIAFLHGGVVDQYHWLSEKQFLDAVAVAMITPGPVVIAVAFIGYLAAGFIGACVAAVGIFLPCYFFVVIPAPYFNRFAQNPQIKAFVDGVTAAAVGAVVGAALMLGQQALTDIPTVLIALVSLGVLYKLKIIPEPVIILMSGIVGLLIAPK